MVHKKYIRKGGKVYGPYLYENKRVNGKVVTTYIGIGREESNKNYKSLFFIIGAILLFSVILLLFLSFRENFFATGRVSLDLDSSYAKGDRLNGKLRLSLKEGELLPADSRLLLNLGSESKEFELRDLVDSEYINGNFYAENIVISGSGEGYGLIGKKESFPDVNFEMRVFEFKDEGSSDTSSEVAANLTEKENQTEDSGEDESNAGGGEATAEEVIESDSSGSSSSSGSNEGSGESVITGAVISGSEFIVSGKVNKNERFNYSLEDGQSAEIVSGSVKVNGIAVDDSEIDLEINGDNVGVSTSYSLEEEGFGEDFLGNDLLILEFNISDFGFIVNESALLSVQLAYSDIKIISIEENVAVISEVINENVESLLNKSVEISLNESTSNLSLNLVVNTTQFSAKLGEPVKWLKKIDSDKAVNLSVEIPLSAENISIRKNDKESPEKLEESIDNEKSVNLEEDVGESNVTSENESDVINAAVDISGNVILGNVGVEIDLDKELKIVSWFKKLFRLTGFVVINAAEEDVQEIAVEVNNSAGGIVEIEYYTESPTIGFEEEIERGKRVRVIGPDDVHYENVLLFTNLSEELRVIDTNKIRIYWEENDSYLPVFNVSDLDDNGIYDYIEWVTPHLSNQTFNIILITKAEHLDSNRTFVQDVYEFVKERDDNWTTIPNEHYIRVTFEVNLTSDKDITIYARSNYSNASVEVYEKDGAELIMSFSNVSEDKEYKILLTGFNGSQDVFDLRVSGGDVEFDYVVDPDIIVASDAHNLLNRHQGAREAVWVNSSKGYVFYRDVNADGAWAMTNNSGQTWTVMPDFDPTSTISHIEVWYDKWTSGQVGDLISIARVDAVTNDVEYTSLNTTSDTLSSTATVFNGAVADCVNLNTCELSITKSRNGILYIAFRLNDGNGETSEVNFSQSYDGTTWTTRADVWEGGGSPAADKIKLAPGNSSDPSDIYAIYDDISADQLSLKTYDNSSNVWNSPVESIIGKNIESTTEYVFDAVQRYSDNHTLVVGWDAQQVANSNLSIWDIGDNNTIVKKTNIITVTAGTTASFVSAMVNQQTNDIYVAYANGTTFPTSEFAVYKKSTDGGTTWGAETKLSGYSGDVSGIYGAISVGDDGGRFMPIWYNTTSDVLLTNFTNSVNIAKNIPPDVIIIDPTNITYTAFPIPFNITTNENSTAKYSLDGGKNNVTMTANASDTGFTNQNSSMSDGSRTVNYYVQDASTSLLRNYTEQITFSLDTTPPIVTINVPANVTYTSLPLNFNVSLNENGSVIYSLNGGKSNKTMLFSADHVSPFGNVFNHTNASIANGGYLFSVYANDTAGNRNYTASISFSVTVVGGNNAPNNPSPIINSSLGTNKTAENLYCFATISDPDGNRLNATVYWYNGTILHLTADFNESFANNTAFNNASLNNGNTTKGQNWTCGMRLFDGAAYSSFVNVSVGVNITNTAPSTPSLSSPADASNTTDRTPTFSWVASTDDDNDAITYQLNVTLIAASTCTELSRHVTGISGTSTELANELQCFYDNLDYYNWSVRAYDNENFSAWTSFFRINISSQIVISLPNSSVEFGGINFLETNDTSDDSPRPFLIQNDGNAFVNITINASNLWRTQANPTSFYQFKAANNSFENSSFNWALSKTVYTNVPAGGSPILCIAELNHTNATDTAEIDINITVPNDEGDGARRSFVTFTASFAKG